MAVNLQGSSGGGAWRERWRRDTLDLVPMGYLAEGQCPGRWMPWCLIAWSEAFLNNMGPLPMEARVSD